MRKDVTFDPDETISDRKSILFTLQSRRSKIVTAIFVPV
jgi:hypothetical protein